VTDRHTGLIWQRCSLPSVWSDGRCQSAAETMSLRKAREAAAELGDGWRLPTAVELMGLIDERCGTPLLDLRVFPDLVSDGEGGFRYWTDSPGEFAGMATFVDFGSGRADWHSSRTPLFVRLVKDRR